MIESTPNKVLQNRIEKNKLLKLNFGEGITKKLFFSFGGWEYFNGHQ